jgi:ribosomal protein S8
MRTLNFLVVFSFLTVLSVYSVSAVCLNSYDNYAAEVVLNKPEITYNVAILSTAQNIMFQDNKYVLQSDYSPNLASILESQSGLTTGLSVRLQIPVKSEQETLPYFKFGTTITKGKLNVSGDDYNGWEVSCIKGTPIPQCEFTKGKTDILASLISSGRHDITIETSEDLKNCDNCDGVCLRTSEPKCINKQLKDDVTDVLNHSGLISSFNELTSSYKILASGNRITENLEPLAKQDINWNEAMRQELVRLRGYNIISLSDEDVEQIANLSEEGKAGQNLRIVYGEDVNDQKVWLYYKDTKFPILTKLVNCNEFPLSSMPGGVLAFSKQKQQIPTYYLVPIMITAFLLLLFIILIVIARLIDRRRNLRKRKKKLKPITGLSSS